MQMQSINSLNWSDNSSFYGECLGSYPNGKGLYTDSSGHVYEGIWNYGFSFGLFRVWLEKHLEIHDPYKIYIERKSEEINFFQKTTFLDLSIWSPVFHLKAVFFLANQILANSKYLISEYHVFLQSDIIQHSDDIIYGNREYSCGGKFPSYAAIKEKIISISMLFSPLRELNEAMIKLESDIEIIRNFLLTSYKCDQNEKETIIQFVNKFTDLSHLVEKINT